MALWWFSMSVVLGLDCWISGKHSTFWLGNILCWALAWNSGITACTSCTSGSQYRTDWKDCLFSARLVWLCTLCTMDIARHVSLCLILYSRLQSRSSTQYKLLADWSPNCAVRGRSWHYWIGQCLQFVHSLSLCQSVVLWVVLWWFSMSAWSRK
jgi:hypothetical protein